MRHTLLPLPILLLAGCARADAHPEPHGSGLARRALEAHGPWTTVEREGIHVHVPAAADAAREAEGLARAAAEERAAALALLGEEDDAGVLELIFLPTPGEMRALLGYTPGGHAEPASKTALFRHAAGGNPQLRHEIVHVLAERLWGPPRNGWLHEGLAVHASGSCGGMELHVLARALDAEGRLVPLPDFPRRFDVRDEGAYVQAGSLVRHVRERHGAAALRAFWSTGLSGVRDSLGVDRAELERAWLARVRAADAAPVDWAEVRRGCEGPRIR